MSRLDCSSTTSTSWQCSCRDSVFSRGTCLQSTYLAGPGQFPLSLIYMIDVLFDFVVFSRRRWPLVWALGHNNNLSSKLLTVCVTEEKEANWTYRDPLFDETTVTIFFKLYCVLKSGHIVHLSISMGGGASRPTRVTAGAGERRPALLVESGSERISLARMLCHSCARSFPLPNSRRGARITCPGCSSGFIELQRLVPRQGR